MKLVRFAILNFETRHDILGSTLQIGDVLLKLVPVSDAPAKQKTFLAITKVSLCSNPAKNSENEIEVPAIERKKCEFAIDSMADIISSLYGCRRSILSPAPSVAIEWDSDHDRKFLEESSGIHAKSESQVATRPTIPISSESVSALTDRLAGAHLIAEAYGGGEALMYREFVRLFELAFRRQFTILENLLFKYLKPTRFCYSRDEVRTWVSLRNAVSHADMQKTTQIGSTADVMRFVHRMEQAALDVLFNKLSWGDSSIDRRDFWIPESWTTTPHGSMQAIQGTKLSILFRLFDEFDVYPRNLTASLTDPEPNWYVNIAK